MNNALLVDISQCTPKLSDPESYGVFRERFPRDVKPQIASIHEVYHNVSNVWLAMVTRLVSRPRYAQILDILKAVPQVTQKWMIKVLEHPPFPYYVPHALRPHNFILSDVLQRESQSSVFPFHNPDFSKSALSNHTE